MTRVWNIGLFCLTLAIAATLLLNAQKVTAHFMPAETFTTVEIDGVNFGRFDLVEGMDSLVSFERSDAQATVTLGRDFITAPSLYLWARNAVSDRIGLRDIKLVEKNQDGELVRSYTLKLCQPISWTVETAAPGAGGFHETVKLAVQNISVQ